MNKHSWILTLSIFGWIWGPPSSSTLALEQFNAGHYAEAKKFYLQAKEENTSYDQEINYNLGQCFRQLDSLKVASEFYEKAEKPGSFEISSMALNNKGVIQVLDAKGEKEKLIESLKTFQDALRKMPANEEARFNYELIKRMLEKQQPPPPDSQPPPPDSTQKPPKPKQNPKEGQGNNGSMKPIPLDQAKKQLDALRQQEKTFIQQMKKRFPPKYKPHDSQDW